MAEIAAGAYIASEVIEHGAQAGYAAYLVSKPTLPLAASFTRIATASGDHTERSLARSHHTVTVVGNKAYIFGGTTADNLLASNDIHAITVEHSEKPDMDYGMIPALPTVAGSKVITARTNHAACAFHGNIAIYGGSDGNDQLVEEQSSVWLFNPGRKAWDQLAPSSTTNIPGPRCNAKLFEYEESILLYGGNDATGDAASDLWKFDVASKTWSQFPTAPVATTNAALANGQLYLVSGTDAVSSQLHHIGISSPPEEMSWESFAFPTNPLAPGPRARHDGAFLPLTTGWGRNYITYLMGARDDTSTPDEQNQKSPGEKEHVTQFSDTWVLQIPASDIDAKPAWSLKNALKPAKIKDAIRHAIGASTGHLVWAEAVVQTPTEKQVEEEDGKLHPGPRAFFGADVMENGHSVVLWGGVDAKGQRIGDGWIVKFS
ncbi:hypothetical protein FB567DRAFT_503997 [Paraphoma chrysanthemicola]|uniref:Galactose oxidase n=1 Tax=Paraphoma chrysanthemicola TaxID=798071 RepID=A0A8K0QXF8_9PLEO|nr:hypothetical protein FB567DRAFT_503997 [Paraphoma chrysanthemicola]